MKIGINQRKKLIFFDGSFYYYYPKGEKYVFDKFEFKDPNINDFIFDDGLFKGVKAAFKDWLLNFDVDIFDKINSAFYKYFGCNIVKNSNTKIKKNCVFIYIDSDFFSRFSGETMLAFFSEISGFIADNVCVLQNSYCYPSYFCVTLDDVYYSKSTRNGSYSKTYDKTLKKFVLDKGSGIFVSKTLAFAKDLCEKINRTQDEGMINCLLVEAKKRNIEAIKSLQKYKRRHNVIFKDCF